MKSDPTLLTLEALDRGPRARHAFFTREGGVSEGIFDSLNCGFGSGDAKDAVAENRERAMAGLDIEPDRLVTLYQVHSAEAVVVERPWKPGEGPKADAMATNRPDVVLGILTADCAPVLLADPDAGVIGAAHAGWKGALTGVLESVVAAMTSLGGDPARIAAGIGPCIAQASYEVGPEFEARFLAADPASAAFFERNAESGRPHFDLKGYAARRLERAGVGSVQVMAEDTCAEEARFFSYRRSCHRKEGDYGRGLSAIRLAP
jgi:YfiH family protein